MIRFLIRVLVFILSAALGLLAADWLIDGVELGLSGFVTAVVIFAVLQSVLTPFIAKMAKKYASAFVGGAGLLSAFVGLLFADWLTDGITITGGVTTWVLATLVVWLVTAFATLLLPMLFVKKAVKGARNNQAD